MAVKRHMAGGSLRVVMAEEVRKVLHLYHSDDQKIVKASLHLGVTPKTLRQWLGPIDKGGWSELQVDFKGALEKVMKVIKKAPKKKKTAKKVFSGVR